VRTKEKPQISPLRFAPVEMTNLFQEDALSTQWKKGRELLNKFVISTGAKRSGEICGFSLVLPPSKARTYPEILVQRVFPRPF
jgi:hypothetical protein